MTDSYRIIENILVKNAKTKIRDNITILVTGYKDFKNKKNFSQNIWSAIFSDILNL